MQVVRARPEETAVAAAICPPEQPVQVQGEGVTLIPAALAVAKANPGLWDSPVAMGMVLAAGAATALRSVPELAGVEAAGVEAAVALPTSFCQTPITA